MQATIDQLTAKSPTAGRYFWCTRCGARVFRRDGGPDGNVCEECIDADIEEHAARVALDDAAGECVSRLTHADIVAAMSMPIDLPGATSSRLVVAAGGVFPNAAGRERTQP